MEGTTKLDIDDSWYTKLKEEFRSARTTDDEMCSSMKRVYDEFNYCIDPHTAVAVAAAEKMGYDLYNFDDDDDHRPPYAIMSTASPYKFEESVTIGIGKMKWQAYAESHFPRRTASILKKDEIEPS